MNIRSFFLAWFISLAMLVQLLTPLHGQSSVGQSSVGDKLAVVHAQGAVLLDDANQPTGVTLKAGALLIIKGRSADSARLLVVTEEGERGWVTAGALLVVNIASLPLIEETALPLAAATPSAVKSQRPDTATAKLSPTAVATAGQVVAQVVTTAQRLNLRSGPDASYPVIGKAESGSQWLAFGRTPASDWVQISVAGTDAIFWAASDYLRLSAPLEQLPVLSGVILPTPTPTIQPTSSANELGLALLPTPTPRPSMPSPAALSTSTPLLAATRTGKTGLSGTLVFQDRIGGTIYVYNLGTDSLRALSGGIDPAISPDGSQAAFTRDGGVSGLYVINLDGSDERRLYNDRELLRSPKWSPDGSRIVFTRSNGYIDCRILKGQVCMPDDAIFDLLPDELQDDMQTHKVIQGLPNQRQYFFTLSRLRLDNGEFRDIAAKGAAGAPDWSYGGIVYQSDNGLQRTDDQPDAESVQVAQDVQMGNYIDPDQQPNGGRIVFQHSRGGHWQIYGINPDGSGLAALTSLATVMVDALPSNVSPAWSPDGQHIVYLSNRNSYESAGPWHLWVMNGDGSEQRRLPIDIEFNYAFGSEQMVSWGP